VDRREDIMDYDAQVTEAEKIEGLPSGNI
jgi:hypothetical protein